MVLRDQILTIPGRPSHPQLNPCSTGRVLALAVGTVGTDIIGAMSLYQPLGVPNGETWSEE